MSSRTLCIIACHTSDSLKQKSLIHNLKYLIELSSNIVIINSIEFKNNNIEGEIKNIYNNIEINFIYKNNDNMYDAGKWIYYLNNNDLSNYDKIILTNDSFIITRSLYDFNQLIENDEYEMVSMIDSNENKYHFTSFFRSYNKCGIQKYIDYVNKNIDYNLNYSMLVFKFEIETTQLFNCKKCLYNVESDYYKNLHFYEYKLKEYLYLKNYPIIKIKGIFYLKCENISDIKDFDPSEYKAANLDLFHLKDTDLISHFKNHAVNECRIIRIYKSPPIFFVNYLANIGFHF